MSHRFLGAVLKGAASLLLSGFLLGAWAQTAWQAEENFFAFGTLSREAAAEHTFYFRNTGAAPLRIRSVHVTGPLAISNRLTNPVPPGERVPITVRFGMPRELGRYEGEVLVGFENRGVEPMRLRLTAEIVDLIGFRPFPAFFVSTLRGEAKEGSMEIISHQNEPLEIMRVENPSSRFTTRLETVEVGKHYKLHLHLHGQGPAGKTREKITLVTTSQQHPFLEITANTYVHERVYTFPDTIEFGTISTLQLKARPDLVSFVTQTLMVYQVGGEDFQASVQTDVPFLNLSAERSRLQDRYQVTISVIPEKLKSGKVNGSILISTNDPEFPFLKVPVKTLIEGNW